MEYKNPFTSLEEAQKVVNELNELSARNTIGFCPLIKDSCRKDCVCYRVAKVAERKTSNTKEMQ